MGNPLSKAFALATGVAIAFIAPATAAPMFEPMFGPMFVPGAPTVQSDVARVSDSARIIRRGRLDNDGGAGLSPPLREGKVGGGKAPTSPAP